MGELASRIPGDRYLDLERHLAGADIVHSAELGVWFSGQPAALKERLGFKLVLTVWETIPFRDTFRAFRGRRVPARSARARRSLPRRHRASAPVPAAGGRRRRADRGVVPRRRRRAVPGRDRGSRRRPPRRLARPARLGEGALRRAPRARDARRNLLARCSSATGPSASVCSATPTSSASAAASRSVRCRTRRCRRSSQPPRASSSAACRRRSGRSSSAWCSRRRWPPGAPILASSSGAIPEVLGPGAQLFAPGDWVELARLLAEGPLARPPGERVEHDPELVRRYSLEAAADRLRSAYRRVL